MEKGFCWEICWKNCRFAGLFLWAFGVRYVRIGTGKIEPISVYVSCNLNMIGLKKSFYCSDEGLAILS